MSKVYKNIFASASPQVMNIITNLILPTMIIMGYGSEVNGLVASTKTIVAYVSIVGAGIASAITQSLYEPVANSDIKQIKGMLHAADKMFNKYGIIYCIIVSIVAFVFPYIIHTSIDYYVIVLLVIGMGISGASEFFAIGRCRALLYANQRTYVDTTIQAVSICLSLVLAVVMLNLRVSIFVVQFAISSVYIFRAFFLVNYINKCFPMINDYKSEPPIKTAVAKRKDAMIHQLTGFAVVGSQTTILTILIDLKAASIYAIYNIVFSGLQSISSNLCAAVTPFLGRELALNNMSRLIKMHNLIEFTFFNLTTLLYSISIIMIIPFISLYTKGADINYINVSFAVTFLYASAFYILKLPSSALINISGLFKETRSRALVEAGLTVILSIILTILIGLNGVILGTGIALGWRCIDTILYTNKHILHIGNRESLLRLVRVLVIISTAAIFQYFHPILSQSYLEWILQAFIVTFVITVIIIINALIFEKYTSKLLFSAIKNKTIM